MAPRDHLTLDCYEIERPVSDVHNFYRNFCDAIDGKCEQFIKNREVRRVLLVMENAFKSKNANDGIELRCIDEIALFCNSLVYNYPLYNTKGNSDTISVAIIGCGRTGMGMLRTVYWAGRIDGFKLKIRVYDKDADKIREELLAKCPQVSDDDTVRFINTEVSGADFREKILREENSADATYIVVAMNEDRGNLMVAEELYKLYRRHRGFDQSRMPEIFARVRSFVKSQPYFENAEFLKSRNINLFGTAESVFSGRTLFNTELENLAFAVHLAYWGALDKQVDEKEYSKRERRHLGAAAVGKTISHLL